MSVTLERAAGVCVSVREPSETSRNAGAAAGGDRARARSFTSGSEASYAPAFPSVPGPGTPLARAKRLEGQGEQS